MSRRGAAACLYPCYRIAPALTLRQAHVPPEQKPGQSARSRERSLAFLAGTAAATSTCPGTAAATTATAARRNWNAATAPVRTTKVAPDARRPCLCGYTRVLAALSPSCQIVHRWPWAASHEAAAVHLPKRNSLASATRDLTHTARLTLQAAGSQWEAVLIHASTPCFNARSVACLMRTSSPVQQEEAGGPCH